MLEVEAVVEQVAAWISMLIVSQGVQAHKQVMYQSLTSLLMFLFPLDSPRHH